MMKNNTIPPFFIYILCMVSYFTAIFANDFSLSEHLQLVNLSLIQYEQIILFKLLGRLAAAITLLLVIQRFSFKTLIIGNIVLYWISLFYIIFIEPSHSAILLCFFIYSATIIIISTLLLGYILINSKTKDLYSISIYVISVLIAYVASITFEHLNLTSNAERAVLALLAFNIIPIGIFIITLTVSPLYNRQINLNEYRFFPVLKHMEIETLLGFVIFFCIVEIEEGYLYYATANSLAIFDNITRVSINLFAMLIAINVTIFYIDRFNKHKISLACLIILSFACVTMLNWNKYAFLSILGRLVLITSLYMIFISSLLMLAQKFRGINLLNAIAIYALSATLGYYCGYITIDTAENTLGHNGLLISICFVLIGLLLYYLYFFKKHKLYR